MATALQLPIPSLAKKALRRRILNAALTAPEWRESLAEAAREIRGFAKPTATEATIAGAFERILYARLREIGLQFHPEKETVIDTKRHVTHGRMDSRLGALVIEYKRPSLLKNDAEIAKALKQLKEYLASLSTSSDIPYVGLLTNGLVQVEIRAVGGAVVSESPAEKVSGATLLRLTQHFISLALTALTPTNLIRDFCGSQTDGILFKVARVLNDVLSHPEAKTRMLYSEWEEMFRLAHNDQSQQKRIQERRESLAALFGITITESDAEYRALFALHTAYAILLKFMAYRTVSDIYFGEVDQDYKSLATASSTSLRSFCNGLEDGEVFRRLKIINLLEGDFFSWYCDKQQWTPEIAESIRQVIEILARYEEVGHIFEANEAPDLFRELYQAAVPRVVRSTFGEFYTPYWLAERVLESASPRGDWRAIDPCCGSGTFVIAAIAEVRDECYARGMTGPETLSKIISRVAAIDLNPLGVLTTRINYFIHISNFLNGNTAPLLIPVFLGDAAAIPDRVTLEGVDCLSVTLKTLKKPIKAVLPISLVQNTAAFMNLMLVYEGNVKSRDAGKAKSIMLKAVPATEKPFSVCKAISELTDSLVELEKNGWNGIWARIISNFLTTACLGRFSVVIGNPPWIDWKNLPEGYRERIKGMCIERGLFSGAGRTGGINLNICALISYVSMTNWLETGGKLAFLMPRELAYQASYEGWRNLGGKWKFLGFHDWSSSGHPFDPVKEDFMTFVLGSHRANGKRGIPVTYYTKKADIDQAAPEWTVEAAKANLEISNGIAGQIIPGSTAFTFAKDKAELDAFAIISGESEYIGREGVEFYPQELLLFKYSAPGPQPDTVWLHNIQVAKSKYRIPRRRVMLETKYLYPLVKGPEIGMYRHDYSGLIVAFPYDAKDPIRPIDADGLRDTSPHLLNYYEQAREIIEQQTEFSDKIRGDDRGEFYGLARTGPYSFASNYVAFRDNTKWRATVIGSAEMPWGERKRFVFQNHSASMCERRAGGTFITKDEAHYICAILNVPVVERFIYASSDNRSFKIRPPVFIPIYDPDDAEHSRLAEISKEAHARPERIDALRRESESVYLKICKAGPSDAMIAQMRLDEINEEPDAVIAGVDLEEKMARWGA